MRRCLLAAAVAGVPAFSGLPHALAQNNPVSVEPGGESSSALSEWWGGKHASGNWFGARDALNDNGLQLSGRYWAGYFAVLDSQRGSRGFYDQELNFSGILNVGKLVRTDVLRGLQLEVIGRWRDPASYANPNNFALANPIFNPAPWQGGFGWRLQAACFEWNSRDLLPVEDMIQVRGGWLRPWSEFLIQPLSLMFMNNAIISAKGIGANIPFSTSYTTWGGSLRVKPTEGSYVKAGLYMASPQLTATNNRGLAFAGYGPDPSRNGLFGIVEAALLPKIGPSQLPGKYAMGGYYYGQEKNSYFGTPHDGQFGFYWQVDQMLFRESARTDGGEVSLGKESVPAKSLQTPVSMGPPDLSEQGLSMFSLLNYAPKYNNLMPLYFQGGLAYLGAIPSRDQDLVYAGMGFGTYSYYNTVANRAEGGSYQPNYTAVIECGYKISINHYAYVAPYAQYLIRPNGTDNVGNALTIGASFMVLF